MMYKSMALITYAHDNDNNNDANQLQSSENMVDTLLQWKVKKESDDHSCNTQVNSLARLSKLLLFGNKTKTKQKC